MDFLKKLAVNKENFGASTGPGNWSTTKDAGKIDSYNPSTDELIGSVYQCNTDDYTNLVKQSIEAFNHWRTVPAPERGQLVRQLGDALRDNKDALGSLVALEMGKISTVGLAPAIFGPWMNISGSSLATWWRDKDPENNINK